VAVLDSAPQLATIVQVVPLSQTLVLNNSQVELATAVPLAPPSARKFQVAYGGFKTPNPCPDLASALVL
jgi:hypothetical protein